MFLSQPHCRQVLPSPRWKSLRCWCHSLRNSAAAGVAGIYNVEVLGKFRRQGIGSALMQAALRQARELGFRVVVLGATGMGHALYTRLKFREVCTLSFWKYGKMR